MNKNIWYNTAHVSAEDLTQVYLDIESSQVNHLKDFHSNKTQFILGNTLYGPSSLMVLPQSFASLTVQISGGIGYLNWERIELTNTYNYVVGNIPAVQGGGLNITRIDLLYIQKSVIPSSPFAKDFIDTNRNIFQQTVNTRNIDSYQIGIITGVYNIGGATAPSIPQNIIPLSYIHLRDGTNKIYLNDTNSLNEGFVQDIRTVVYAQTI